MAALSAAGSTLLVCIAIAIGGWFFADAGVHGDTHDAIASGALVWLAGHGASMSVADVQLGIMPLGLTGVFALIAYRFGHWAGQSAEPMLAATGVIDAAQPSSLVFQSKRQSVNKTLTLSLGAQVSCYLLVALTTALLVPARVGRVDLPSVVLGASGLSLVFGGAGILIGSGQAKLLWARVPGFIQVTLRGAAIAVLLMVAAGAVVVAVHMVMTMNQTAAVVAGLDLSGKDLAGFALLNLLYLPNVVGFAIAYVAGPGFSAGANTVVSMNQVDLGPVPALPWFASLPEPGAPPAVLLGLLALPVLAGLIAAVIAQRIYAVPALDSAALRGFGVGFAAAIVLSVFCWLSAGSLGDGRMAQIGPNGWEVLMAAGAAMSLGGLTGGLATAAWQRRARRD
ncbi:MAG: hypothetical protein KDB38_04395 [Nocardioidaceae bacterium]|nr:hypothetical protein [Nocardioidaceae bacterium]